LAIKPGGDLLLITHEARMVQTEKWGEIEIRGSGLIEADLDGQETWAWSAFDHLDTERFPNGMSEPRDGVSDWTHANSVQFIEERNQILVSVRNQSQVLLIDRATGDVVWTLGVDGDFELLSGTWFSGQHDASMQPDGSILLYDNGNLKPGNPPTRIVRYVLNEETLQAEEVMDLDMGVLMISMGGVVPLDNGNFLVTLGGHRNRDTPATIVEMSPDGETVWRMAIGPSEPFRTIYRGNVFQFAQPIQ
jgi:hypothetical protein